MNRRRPRKSSSDETRCPSSRLVELTTALLDGLSADAARHEVGATIEALQERAAASTAPVPLELGDALKAAYAGFLRSPHVRLGNDARRAAWTQTPLIDAALRCANDAFSNEAMLVSCVRQRLTAVSSEQARAFATVDECDGQRLLAELCVRTVFLLDTIERLPPLVRTMDDPLRSPAWLHTRRELSAHEFDELRGAAGDRRRSWHNFGLLTVEPCAREGDACKLEIRPLFRSSAARWLDDADHHHARRPALVFPPGTRFAVSSIDGGGESETVIRLVERSHLAARMAGQCPIPALDGRALYHYTLGRYLPSIMDDQEIGVAAALPGADAPAVWLTTHTDWEPSAVKSVVEAGVRRELSRSELAASSGGLFRIRVDPRHGALTWPQFAACSSTPPAVVERLDASGRERGANPDEWYCCPEAVPMAAWLGVEMDHPELGWIALDM